MNSVMYFEIQASDPQRAMDFYKAVFGWDFFQESHVSVDYWQIKTEGMNGGLLKRSAPVPAERSGTNAYVCSMRVENFDTVAQRIIEHGGRVAMPKFAIPGKRWQGYFIDTDDNTFGLFQADENAA
jgi:uncharacterized protein